jgi:hypothetical protein
VNCAQRRTRRASTNRLPSCCTVQSNQMFGWVQQFGTTHAGPLGFDLVRNAEIRPRWWRLWNMPRSR